MRAGIRRALLATSFMLLFLGCQSTLSHVYAHGFGERYDLPVPLWLYITGAGATVALSFVVIGYFIRGTAGVGDYPRLNLFRWPIGRALGHPALMMPLKIAVVFLLGLVVAAGVVGKSEPTDNIAPTMVWVIWWVGLAYVSALVGDFWVFLNPWKNIFLWTERLYKGVGGMRGLSLNIPYPKRFGVWPAVLLFLGFSWAELVFPDSAEPLSISRMVLIYSVITWTGMLFFGVEKWLRHGEAFSVVFGLLARFAPSELRVIDESVCAQCSSECRDKTRGCVNCGDCFSRVTKGGRELNLRPYAVGLLVSRNVSASLMVFVVLVLSTVTFDGFTATSAWADIQSSLAQEVPNATAVKTLGLLVFVGLFLAVYLFFSTLMASASGNRETAGNMARAFVVSLIPIALAYHLAHYLSFLLIQGQLVIPLASDPFGFGWNLFGTVDYRVDISVINARFAWVIAVAAIVVGHIVAVYLAHVMALRILKDSRLALNSQYPMLLLMVGYTMVSLWILAQPIVET